MRITFEFGVRRMRSISNLLDYVNTVMIVDKDLIVRYATRPTRIRGEVSEARKEWYIGKHLLEIFPDFTPENSTLYKCIVTGEPVVVENQQYKDCRGNMFCCNNITWPIKSFGHVVGAVEISSDITTVGDLETLGKTISQQAAMSMETKNKKAFRNADDRKYKWEDIVTSNLRMLECIKNAKIFADTDDPVMIYGETGTGKELFVESMLHENIRRRDKYVVQNCAAIPDNLFESTLFGTVKGGFTNAENRKGLFESADGGILFLDEFNSVPLHLQSKLLRVIQDGIIRPVGGNIQKKVDVKVIVALNKNPVHLIREGLMREDLFYRFSGSMIDLPPLRERKEDIMLYVNMYLEEFCRKYNKNIKSISDELVDTFIKYNWPGNVRELKNIMDFAIKISNEDVLTESHLPVYFKTARNEDGKSNIWEGDYFDPPVKTLKEVVENAERECIVKTLIQCNGNVTHAAKVLGLPRQTLKFHMDKLNITSVKQHKKPRY